ncbi:MAG TPA: hypothetical protein VIR04_01760 [Paralcaligenes sp.]|jgi:hypothetical protein
MKLSRGSRLTAALVALVSMLFMQMALAGYACPGYKTGLGHDKVAMAQSASDMAMPGCEQVDLAQPNLCQAAIQIAHQSLDKPQVPHVHAFVPVTTMLVAEASALYRPITGSLKVERPQRHTAPPISTLRSRLRI